MIRINMRPYVESKEDRRRRRKRQIVSCCRQLAAFTFSHVGLASIVVAYSIVGALLFQALEAPHEERSRKELLKQRDK